MMNRGYNFGAGPAMLPESILKEVQSELLNWQGTGMSVLEIGHRTKAFTSLMEEAELLVRELLFIPENYHVLFISGATRLQFGMIPMNFLAEGEQAGYLVTGLWSSLAYDEACKLKKAYTVTNAVANGFTNIPPAQDWEIKQDSKYLYYVPNETVNGLRLGTPPQGKGIPLVADMTSCLLSEPINVCDYQMIFAGAQKNIANAGLTLVIISDEFLNSTMIKGLPTMLDYHTFSTTKSAYATPPTFNCYLALKMLHWVKAQGGVNALYEINCKKAKKLYDFIDSSSFYQCKVAKEYRSLVNVCFSIHNQSLETPFLDSAAKAGLLALQGHRVVGGLRASMYNSMPMEAVDLLIHFMQNFAEERQ